ncbi:SGNH/GDSL hydrolase family protein [Alicyclobacillus mali (ex Roth et al. 2021)]|uniref:SGNH/GDSL hydrolase family protein n=1 Tax=Alicyclobacillus mali (ex Roth et al. 2021) TaxID=1123961 RepID=UPI001A90734F|nr:SGNH/GDSL hydrolase family protein [Alicyclobacillus mali (ex Roth et al. 2021)]
MKRRWQMAFLTFALVASALWIPASLTARAAEGGTSGPSVQPGYSASADAGSTSMHASAGSGVAPNPLHGPGNLTGSEESSGSNGAANAPNAPAQERVVRVLIIGSSVARGWKDPKGGGYLHRTFSALSTLTPITYDVIDKAEPGKGVLSIRNTYAKWLETYQPQIVCIAWGGLDDLYQHTPFRVYDEQVRWQIQEALDHRAMVMLVTTPVSKASYTTYRVAQQALMESEIQVADSFHNPNVYVFNVFDQMKAYLQAHHESIQPLMHDSWHPNARGHALAAELLVKDILGKFPVTAPVFKAEPSSSADRARQESAS